MCVTLLRVRYLERLTGLDALHTGAVDACIDWDSGSSDADSEAGAEGAGNDVPDPGSDE